MTILLTGATGFLGSYLLKSFVNSGHETIALKRTTSNTYRIDNYLKKVTLYDIEKVTLEDIFKNHKIDIVINTVTNYGRINNKISSILDTNLIFGLKLLEDSVNANVKTFINTDTLLERNINAYALSKAQLVDWMKFLSNKNTKMINIKIEHMYGVLDDENKFIYWLINQLKQNVEKINLTSGVQKRDFIYITDIVNGYETIIQNINKLSKFEEIELGSGNSIEVKKFVKQIVKELKLKQEINTNLNFGVVPYRDNENMEMKADIQKLTNLGWKAKVSIEDGIKKIINEEK
ncbi:NAD-dependent epimerase/dehydratase family protein [Arcobacter porcinus]|uniref:NAD-dependent epimerase/dehydratase n=1 Tax=Arcobacter porcinus TaxID=1935204 RepID=A0A5C2HCG4_9BACT|nr:NAD-dependent epimerase/dehydratase [Arcobacter porcinus]OCL92388.1 dTDP-4-dehydro-6-deoxyglucose reductase [Aliarcobacter thereius]QEP40519.1 NAD-dependent epimerase/dehydratase [Arcobacter porcinus]